MEQTPLNFTAASIEFGKRAAVIYGAMELAINVVPLAFGASFPVNQGWFALGAAGVSALLAAAIQEPPVVELIGTPAATPSVRPEAGATPNTPCLIT